MGVRSCLLHQIQQALQWRGVDVELRSIPELRAQFKGLQGPLLNADLGILLAEIPKASEEDLRQWMTAPTKPPKQRRRSWEWRGKLIRSEILSRHAAGISVIKIAREADRSVSRIYQIIKEGEKHGHLVPD